MMIGVGLLLDGEDADTPSDNLWFTMNHDNRPDKILCDVLDPGQREGFVSVTEHVQGLPFFAFDSKAY